MQLDVSTLLPLSTLNTTACGEGRGLAVCPHLRRVVTSCRTDRTLSVFALPELDCAVLDHGTGLELLHTLGGPESPPPMQFWLEQRGGGYLAFCGPPTARFLLVTDSRLDTAHVVDIVARTHVGYLAPSGSIASPNGVAACGDLAAVACRQEAGSGCWVVRMFQGSRSEWTPLRVLGGGFPAPGRADGQLQRCKGLRFSADGSEIAVADFTTGRVSMFRAADGTFLYHLTQPGVCLPVTDVEQVQGDWLVSCGWSINAVVQVKPPLRAGLGCGHAVACLGDPGDGPGQFQFPTAMAYVPGLGLVVRELDNGRLQVFAAPDAIAMVRMSKARVGWLVAVARAVLVRARSQVESCRPGRQ